MKLLNYADVLKLVSSNLRRRESFSILLLIVSTLCLSAAIYPLISKFRRVYLLNVGKVPVDSVHLLEVAIENPTESEIAALGIEGNCVLRAVSRFPLRIPPGESRPLVLEWRCAHKVDDRFKERYAITMNVGLRPCLVTIDGIAIADVKPWSA